MSVAACWASRLGELFGVTAAAAVEARISTAAAVVAKLG
jgi:hypothetical protein